MLEMGRQNVVHFKPVNSVTWKSAGSRVQMSARCVGGEQRVHEQAVCPAGVRASGVRERRAERMAF